MSTGTRDDLRNLLGNLTWPRTVAPRFDPDTAPDDPVQLFVAWLGDAAAAGVPAPHAMTLATVDAAGRPDARTTLLEDVDESAFWVSGSTTSPKGKQLSRVPVAALVFHWPLLGRQVRVRGTVRPADEVRTAEAFGRLSPEARADALVDRQSGPLHDEEWLSDALGDAGDLLRLEPGAVAPTWRLWGVDAGRLEFFQSAADGHHLRLRYSRRVDEGNACGYVTEMLKP
ncbi:pyridoxine/pyridoxamine 5'-phosphate oxidase [Kineococcus sp. SYSU DK006]|uniref:pyridoxine/pyridoxamine 5'-phosphate oxidase n=1 Tax=Kineococcus sp. SYSU DK006 TaxID=3383127 RepID=UPI003D7CD438